MSQVSKIQLTQLQGGFVKVTYTSIFGYEYIGTYPGTVNDVIRLAPNQDTMSEHLELKEIATRSHIFKVNAASHLEINRDCLANLRVIKYAKQPIIQRRYTVLFQNGFGVHYPCWQAAFFRLKQSAIQCVIYDQDTGTVWAAKKYVQNSRR